MKTNTLKFQFLFVFVVVVFSACTNNDKQELSSDATSTDQELSRSYDFTYKFDDHSQKFKVQVNRARKIDLPSGTQIKIPANCFVDENGERVKTEVDLVFEEFLSAGSIIASQINMKYDSSGKLSDFESAGMFRINGFENNKQVFIAPNKSIEVSLASTDDASNFNSYYSKENGNDWQYFGASLAEKNKPQQKRPKNLNTPEVSTTPPIKPVAYSANGKYFDLNISNAYNHDLKNLIGIVWEYAGNDKSLDPAQNKTNFNRKWDHVSVLPAQGDKRGVYNITLQGLDTNIRTMARPVFRGVVLDAENEAFAQELGEFNARMEQLRNQEERAMAESSFIRTLQVKNFGLYNYDRQYHYEDMTPVYANFNFGDDTLRNYPITVFLITGNGMAVI